MVYDAHARARRRSLMSTANPRHARTGTPFLFLWLGVLGHLLWGAYPVFAKRAMQEVPKFSLLIFAWLMVAAAGIGVTRVRDGVPLRTLARTLLHTRTLWALSVFVVLRSVSNVVAIDLTRAVWVQLIYLLTPFVVALLGSWLFNQPTPRFTYGALLLGTLGSALVLVEDWSQVAGNFSQRDIWGLGTALFSMLALAMYFQMVRRSHLRAASPGMIMTQQGLSALPVFGLLSLLSGEDWHAWGHVSAGGWLAVLAVIFLVQVSGNLIQITAVSKVSPAAITNMMALRLVSALTLGWLILGEQLHTVWQWVGVGIVIGTVTLYLRLQRS